MRRTETWLLRTARRPAPRPSLPRPVLWRLLILNATGDEKDELVLVNPRILERSGPATLFEEGCLSFPGIYAEVERPENCRVQAFRADGTPFEESFGGFTSRIIQHEYDHLEGVLLVDRMSPADRLKKLFIPFYTTKSRGTGLGLAIAQRIVSQHGGTIEVRSTPGEGSTFSVFLPAAPGVPASAVITGPISLAPLRQVPSTQPPAPAAAPPETSPGHRATPEPMPAAAVLGKGRP